jgi:hypothetical protein
MNLLDNDRCDVPLFHHAERAVVLIRRLVVLLDRFSTHRVAVAITAAESMGTQLVLIPPGCADTLQPLDRPSGPSWVRWRETFTRSKC